MFIVRSLYLYSLYVLSLFIYVCGHRKLCENGMARMLISTCDSKQPPVPGKNPREKGVNNTGLLPTIEGP